jgi:hypothetical protein
MNKYIAMGAGAVIGGGIGFVVAHILVERFMNKPEEGTEEESNETFDGETGEEEMALVDDEEPASHRLLLKKHSPEIDYTMYAKIDPKPDLAKLAAKYNRGVVDEKPELQNVFAEMQKQKEKPVEVDPNEPHVITMEDYADNQLEYSYTALRYHGGDDMLCSERGLPLTDPEKLLGDALNHFDGERIIYVMNPRLKALYEVEYTDDPFYHTERDIRTKTRRVSTLDDGETEE